MLIDLGKLKQFRISRGLSRAALARKIGLSRAQMYNIEKGGRTSEETLSKLATTLNLSVDDLLPYRADSMPNKQSSEIYTLALAKAKRAGLAEDELKRLGEVVGKVVDILTIEDHQERKRHSSIISGMINLYHSVIFQPGGRESVRLSSSLKKDRAKAKL